MRKYRNNISSDNGGKRPAAGSVLKRLVIYLRPQIGFVFLSVILSAAITASQLYIPVLIGRAVDNIAGPGAVDFDAIGGIALRMAAFIAAAAVCQWLVNIINNGISVGTARRMRLEVFAHIEELPFSYLDSNPHGDLLSRAVVDIEQISDGLLMGFTQLFTGVLTIVITLVIMFSIDPLIAAVVVALTPLSFLIARFVAKNSRAMFGKQSISRGALTAYSDEMLENIKLVNAFGYGSEAEKKFNAINDELKGYSLKATFFSSLVNPSTRLINAMIYACVAIFGALSAVGGAMSVGTLVTFLSYTTQYSKPFNEITSVIAEFQNALASAKRVFELLDEEVIVEDAEITDLGEECKSVTMENIDFSYVPGKKIIKGFSLSLPAGCKAAIVGPTGCGKTTLINLLMRFYDPDSGRIMLDDTDISRVTRSGVRNQFAMVLQDTWLKTDTVRNNIAYGKPDASIDEIVAAAKEASADAFIRRLPQGYDTLIKEGGNLSAGERQLLCVARVMLSRPPMVILDEATSSIDSMTEMRITRDFDKIMKGRTSIVVAHRLSTIKGADIIIAMKDGQIVESGTHEELLKKGGFYSKIYNSQFRRA